MDNVWFSADPHFGHKNILRMANRPFSTIEDMDATIMENYNTMVGNGTLYLIGDFAFRDEMKYAQKLKCRTVFITGNHDKHMKTTVKAMFYEYHPVLERNINGIDFSLYHYACRVWNKSHHGSYHLYGHSHGTLPDDPNSRSFDCGVDCFGYKPVSFNQVVTIMHTKNWIPVDHHGSEE